MKNRAAPKKSFKLIAPRTTRQRSEEISCFIRQKLLTLYEGTC